MGIDEHDARIDPANTGAQVVPHVAEGKSKSTGEIGRLCYKRTTTTEYCMHSRLLHKVSSIVFPDPHCGTEQSGCMASYTR